MIDWDNGFYDEHEDRDRDRDKKRVQNKMDNWTELITKIEAQKQYENEQLCHVWELLQNDNIQRKERKV